MGRHTILLIDDEKNILSSLHRILRKGGYRLLTANSGKEGLEILKKEKVSLIISDHRMPEMTGIELLNRVKSLYPDIVRIILSGYTEVNSIVSAINDGAVYKFILKPWNDEDLTTTVIRAIEQVELQEENKRLTDEIKTINMNLEKKIKERTKDLDIMNQTLRLSQTMLENLPIAVIGLTQDGIISMANKTGREIVKPTKGTILGLKIDEVFPEEIITSVKNSFETNVKHELKGFRCCNDIYDVSCNPVPLRYKDKGVVLVLVKKFDA